MKHFFCVLCVMLLVCMTSFSQEKVVEGYVFEKGSMLPLPKVIVTICNQKNTVLYSTTTSQEGRFHFSTKDKDISSYNLKVSCMGYKSISCLIGTQTFFKIELEAKAYELKDVYVKTEKIRHHNDTTSYLVSGFSSAKDRTIGDVLKKMPGIGVSKSGSVSYNGKTISEFLIEGVDLFDGQYNIATRNISHDLISRVDVIENYQSAKVMKNSKSEGETVLNLSLKDKAKGRWSGNAKAGGGLPRLWEEELFSARLSGNNQTAITLKTNNSGKDILSENNVLTMDDYMNKYVVDEANAILDVSQGKPGMLDDRRTRDARTHLINIGHVQKVSESAILHSKVYYTDDRNISDKEQGETYFLEDSILTKNTKEYSCLRIKELAASLLYKTDTKENFFSDELKGSALWQNNHTNISGYYSNVSKVSSNVFSLENNLKWITMKGEHLLTIESRNKYKSLPETLSLKADGQSSQHVKRNQFLSVTKLDYTWNLKRWSFSLKAEGIVSASDLHTDFISDDIDTSYYENTTRNFFALVARPCLAYKYKRFRSELQVPLSLYHYWGTTTTSSDRMFCIPQWTVSWQVNSHWKFRTNLSLGNTATSVNNIFASSVMTDNKTFRSSPLVSYVHEKKNFAFAVHYADYVHMFFGNASIGYNWGKDNSTTTKRVDRDLVYYSRKDGNNTTKGTMLLGNISKRINIINGTVNAKCFCFFSNASITQNGSPITFDTNSIQTSLGVNSNVHNWLEVDYRLGYNINTLSFASVNSSTKSLTQELQVSVLPIEVLTLTIAADHYANFFSSVATKQTLFGDVRCTFRYRKVDFIGSVNNVFNQRSYCYTTYSDLSSSYTQYSLRGRNFLLSIVAYF